jgi:hypothetical protein
MPGLAFSAAVTQPRGERTLIPRPLSSQTNSNGSGSRRWLIQPAALNAVVAAAWLIDASPNEQTAIASVGHGGAASTCPGAGVTTRICSMA